MIRRFVFQWLPLVIAVVHAVALGPGGIGISHMWLQKLVREFKAGPSKMWRLQRAKGDPQFAGLGRANKYSRQIRERGELRGGLY
jgi:hypothetical protein